MTDAQHGRPHTILSDRPPGLISPWGDSYREPTPEQMGTRLAREELRSSGLRPAVLQLGVRPVVIGSTDKTGLTTTAILKGSDAASRSLCRLVGDNDSAAHTLATRDPDEQEGAVARGDRLSMEHDGFVVDVGPYEVALLRIPRGEQKGKAVGGEARGPLTAKSLDPRA